MHHSMSNSRRDFLRSAALFGCAAALPIPLLGQSPATAPAPGRRLASADDILKELIEGNARFVKGQTLNPRRGPSDFQPLAKAQYPDAIIISCADSRVSPEILFDEGVGDLFVIRVAGNVVEGAGVSVKGSIEYAVAELNVPLIVVLGHSSCGAVKAALQKVDDKASFPGSIEGMVELITPAVVQTKGMAGDHLDNAIARNVKNGVDRLHNSTPIIGPKIKEGKLKVVGGVYDLKTGKVTLI